MNNKTIPISLNEPHVDAYPTPPFEHQKQPFPGLASKMHPVPDHGEKPTKAVPGWKAVKR